MAAQTIWNTLEIYTQLKQFYNTMSQIERSIAMFSSFHESELKYGVLPK